jgi:glycosyltransferase involved in cell wall biosynthesis
VVGHTTGDAALMATGRVFVTGPFAPYEAECLIRAQNAAMAFIPSVVPETWCYALTEALRAGLRVAAFDIGAQAERIRAHGEGLLLPLALSARRINDALLAACGVFLHKGPHKESGSGSRCLK